MNFSSQMRCMMDLVRAFFRMQHQVKVRALLIPTLRFKKQHNFLLILVTTIAKGNIGYSWEVPCTAGCVNSPSFHLQNNESEDKPTNETAKILTTLLTSP